MALGCRDRMVLFLHNRYRTTGGEERAVEDLMWLVGEHLGEPAGLLAPRAPAPRRGPGCCAAASSRMTCAARCAWAAPGSSMPTTSTRRSAGVRSPPHEARVP